MNQSLAQYRIKIYLVFLVSLIFAATAVSLYLNVQKTRAQFETFARKSGQAYFKAFVVTRRWNAMHGGVYVPVTDKTKPNKYLEDPLRDVETTKGMKLTLINPAYMTKMISEYLENDDEVNIHITSLNLLNPDNKADEWEESALREFEKGTGEVSSIEEESGREIYRYMAPLVTEKKCLKCHEKQGYKEGDIRGGISVSFPFRQYRDASGNALLRIYIVHALFFIVCTLLIYSLGRALLRNIVELEESINHIKRLEGILPICSSCNKIKDESGEWRQFEGYIRDRSEAQFSHGLCPDCAKELYPDYYKK